MELSHFAVRHPALPSKLAPVNPRRGEQTTQLLDGLSVTENTAKRLTEQRGIPEPVTIRRRIAASFDSCGLVSPRVRNALAKLDQQIDARRFHPGQLVIIDEASLAGNLDLDELVTAANHAAAKVLLVGDYAQLGAVEAGGAFALLVRDRGDLAPHLDTVRRFINEWEAAASLALRRGDAAAIDAHQNPRPGPRRRPRRDARSLLPKLENRHQQRTHQPHARP